VSLRPIRRSLALLALGCAAAAPAHARLIDFPMQLDHAFIRARLVEQLFDGPEESTRVWQDPSGCNDVVLSHPQVSGRDGKLHVRADFDAKLGAGVGNWCFNATRRKGILDAALEARLHPTLPIVEFRVVGSDLYDTDGAKRFTGALWDWVRSQVHPHLETLRLDLYQPIAELKAFVPVLFPASDFARVQQLIDSISLADVAVAADAIAVRVRLDVPEPAEKTAAAKPPEPALSPEEIARWEAAWQSWDGFLTFLIKHSSQQAGDALRHELRDTLLDARHDIVAILEPSQPRDVDPVRPLFLRTWARLAPILRQLTTRLPGEAALHYLSLIAAADAFTALEQLGPDYGVELSTDGLRRMARMIEPAPFSDPTAYSESVDAELRALFDFGPPLPVPEDEPADEGEADALPAPIAPEPPSPPPDSPPPQSLHEPVPRLAIALVAAVAPRSLDSWIPTLEELVEYLPRVRDLLGTTALRTQRKKVLPGRHAALFRNLVLATAWQESCWRQFTRKGKAVQPLTSSVGAVGIMQVNPRVWRGFYDVKALRSSTKYNAQAGSEILHHYLVDYAIKKREDRVRNNPEDLARATYAAYNAGPRQLDRYRRSVNGKTGHRIDADFWKKYQQIKAGNDLAVKSCFPGLAT
jgi:soluble lytic murein transglycosylase-like protein